MVGIRMVVIGIVGIGMVGVGRYGGCRYGGDGGSVNVMDVVGGPHATVT